jgi:hypothetical protein
MTDGQRRDRHRSPIMVRGAGTGPDRLRSADRVERALVLATICLEPTYGGAVERRTALADEAMDIAGATGDVVATVRVETRFAAGPKAPVWLDRHRDLAAEDSPDVPAYRPG